MKLYSLPQYLNTYKAKSSALPFSVTNFHINCKLYINTWIRNSVLAQVRSSHIVYCLAIQGLKNVYLFTNAISYSL